MENYCYECGTKLIGKKLKNEGVVPFCTTCNEYRFPRYNVAVSMIIINKENNKVLLIQQYGKKSNIFVAGYVNKGERSEDAVIRELKEETNMKPISYKFNGTCYFEPSNTLISNFTVYVENDKELKTNEEIDAYNWFTFDEARINIKPNSLAQKFLNACLDEIEGK